MIGAIIGDIVGSRFEFDNIKTKDFALFSPDSDFTDDSILTLSIAYALLNIQKRTNCFFLKNIYKKKEYIEQVVKNQILTTTKKHPYPTGGYGGMFYDWISDRGASGPYNSYGNGAAMRVSSVAYFVESLDDVRILSNIVTSITHNHTEGVKGAEATAVAVFMALHGESLNEIRKYIMSNYYEINFTLDEIRDDYKFDPSCQGTVPQALQCFFESTSFEDAIRNAISIGGDSDTIGAITGAVAGAYYGVPKLLARLGTCYLTPDLKMMLEKIESSRRCLIRYV